MYSYFKYLQIVYGRNKYRRILDKDQMTNQSLQSALGCRKVVMHCVGSFRCRAEAEAGPLTTGEQIKEENPRVIENWKASAQCEG